MSYDLLETSFYPIQDNEQIFETTVGGLLQATAAHAPDEPALVEVRMDGEIGRRWSFSALWTDAELLARSLSSRYDKGEKICVWAPNTPEWILMEYACAIAGVTMVTANPAYQALELRYVLEQSRSVGLFCVAEYRGNPMADIAKDACKGLDGLREIVDLDDQQALFKIGEKPAKLPDVTAGDAVQIQYTSGTTGFPKGAVLSHRSITNNARFFAERTGTGTGAAWACFMPLFHTAGCAVTVLGALQKAAPVYVVKLFDPDAILNLIEAESIYGLIGVPTMMMAMIEAQERQPKKMSSLGIIISGGSIVAPDLVRKVTETFGCAFQTVYGQTECSPLVTQHKLGESLDDICNSVGQPMPQVEVSIRSMLDNSVISIGQVGEICSRGYALMLRYNDNPEATAATIDGDGWLHSGDLGTMDERGYVCVTGRVKEMIIRGGENLYPVEIENTLLDHANVAEIAVVGIPDEKWGEVVAAFVRPVEGSVLIPADLHAYCRENMAPQKAPAIWCEVQSFPLTGSGKIQKFALRDGYLAGQYTSN